MSDDIRVPKHRYNDLINAANQLVTVSSNAATTILLETPYESMLRGPAEALQLALKEVPGSDNWDGVWRDGDVDIDLFRPTSQPERSGPDQGARATHRPTGIAVEAYSKPDPHANQAAATKALKERVKRHAAEQGLS